MDEFDTEVESYSEASALNAFARTVRDFRIASNGLPKDPQVAQILTNDLLKSHYVPDSKSGLCHFHDCRQSAIPHSHVIANAAGISPLADGGHVLTPNLADPLAPTMSEIGRNLASTFPGYCRQHELLFAGFEVAKRFSTVRHYMLQLMRSAAREYWKKSKHVERMVAMVASYELAISQLPIKQSEKEDWSKKLTTPLKALIVKGSIERDYLHFIHKDLTESVDSSELPGWVSVHRHSSELRVAVSGSTLIPTSSRENLMIVLASVTDGPHTLTLFASTSDDGPLVSAYARTFAGDGSMDDLLLAWMSGMDHWFANPTWWYGLPEERRSSILRELVTI